ncbi:hypothetical protein AYI68_g1907 [Smittium mucronatum]|uniref:Uncharacterized protein n=1 Tax=Smittium mucronatum TaxID=133383 RepID=A0A1R0H462_9FUNG|nr:hypothetical protein AYI68_g1907 [Smittium mucronatum]
MTPSSLAASVIPQTVSTTTTNIIISTTTTTQTTTTVSVLTVTQIPQPALNDIGVGSSSISLRSLSNLVASVTYSGVVTLTVNPLDSWPELASLYKNYGASLRSLQTTPISSSPSPITSTVSTHTLTVQVVSTSTNVLLVTQTNTDILTVTSAL